MHTIALQTSSIKIHLIGAALTAVLLVGCSADNGPSVTVPGPPVPTPAAPAPMIGNFMATPSSVPAGGMTTLSYQTTGAVSCMASGAWSGSRPTGSGSEVVTVSSTPGSYSYTLTCTNATGQQTTEVATVEVTGNAVPPAIATFTANPTTVPAGGTTTLTHDVTGATGCTASGSWSGDKSPTGGTEQVTVPTIPGNYQYGLTCTNAAGQQTTRFVTVLVTGSAGDPGAITGDPNDGTTPTDIFDGGTALPDRFVCTASARTYGPNPVTEVRVNGLVGSALTDVLNMLGAGTVTQLQNSVLGKELAVDGSLNTAAQYNLSVGLLGGAISSIDLFVGLNSPAPAEKYAVFLLTFPIATTELSLLQSVTVTTFLGDQQQETQDIDATTLDLAGAVSTADTIRFVGLKSTLPYDGVTISLSPTLVSANVGNAMNVHELCTDGFFVPTPP